MFLLLLFGLLAITSLSVKSIWFTGIARSAGDSGNPRYQPLGVRSHSAVERKANGQSSMPPAWFDTGLRLPKLNGALCIDPTQPHILHVGDANLGTLTFDWQ